ncbi:MAG: hypothetical protein HY678_05680 [Chloroflexi bacterium]|nr:hypothetical protein [Chloroflexota bacterium]
MPDITGRLTPSDENVIRAWLAGTRSEFQTFLAQQYPLIGRAEQVNCPITHDANWDIHGYIVTTPSYATTPRGAAMGSHAYAHVVISCKTCGYEMFLDASKVGVVRYGSTADGS